MDDSLSAAEARQICLDLAACCTPENSSVQFRHHLAAIETAFAEGDVERAAQLVDRGASLVISITHAPKPGTGDETTFLANEDSTHAYATLSDVRFRFGLLTLGHQPSNMSILRA